MQRSIIRPYHSSLTPFEVYRRLYSTCAVSFFLDSPTDPNGQPQYSFLGAKPSCEIILDQGKIQLRGEQEGKYPARQLFPLLRSLMKKYQGASINKKIPFFTGGAVGYWGYEMAQYFDKIKFRKKTKLPYPLLHLGFYRDIVVFDHQKGHYWLALLTGKKEKTSSIEKRFEELKSIFDLPLPKEEHLFHLRGFHPEVSEASFKTKVKKIKKYILAGDIYQANLSQRFKLGYQGDPIYLYEKLREINPSPFACFLKFRDHSIVSSSPERLIRKWGDQCQTRPIAGTRPLQRAGTNTAQIREELLSNEKERAEHIMLVDLERNDLGRVCDYKSVRVKEMMGTEKYSHVMHIVSEVTGKLRKGKDAWDLIQAMFPGGTITGCPKIRCMEIIDELESFERGLYTGSIGYVDFRGHLDLNIVIRTLVLKNGKGHLQVGAGIVHDSDPGREYEETLHKGEALVAALVEASKR